MRSFSSLTPPTLPRGGVSRSGRRSYGAGVTKPRPKKGKTSAAGRRQSASPPSTVPRTAGVTARFSGPCVTCQRGYPVNAPLGKVKDGWAHAACAEQLLSPSVGIAAATSTDLPRPAIRISTYGHVTRLR